MSRITRLLHPDEYPVVETGVHRSALIGPLLTTVAVITVALVVGFVFSPDRGDDLVDVALGIAAAMAALRFAWKAVSLRRKTIVLTDHRILVVTGMVARQVVSIPFGRIGDISYRRPLMGRVLGYGMIEMSGVGPRLDHRPLLRIERLPEPDHFYRTLASLIASRRPSDPEADDAELLVPFDEADTGPIPRVVV